MSHSPIVTHLAGRSIRARDGLFKSDFAILDVKEGRDALARRVRSGDKVLVRIDLLIDTQHSEDDGVSIEFSGEVKNIRQI